MNRKCLGAWVGLGAVMLGLTPTRAQEVRVRGHEDLEALLRERAGITATMPDVGYMWTAEEISGTPSEGSIWIRHVKMIYYFVHWGPIEIETITDEYVRRRIPEIWPSEGLSVTTTRAATVAGHPAVYAEALPRREFYRAQFLIWNCPETARQFIADMNYNVSYLTPRAELLAQIDATTNTLSCHDGAPTSAVDGHVARYDSRRFNLSFAHPLRWYVFESPYGVPHPAYMGMRDESIGSVLAWLEDRHVDIGFVWRPADSVAVHERSSMAGSARKYTAAVDLMSTLEGVESFLPQASETVTIGGREILKVLGKVFKASPDSVTPGFVSEARGAVLVIDGSPNDRQLFVVLRMDDYTIDGVSMPVARDVFDRWAVEILAGFEPQPGGAGG